MTTLQSSITTFTTPMSEKFANVSFALAKYFERRAEKARMASDIKLLATLDPHMLNDIGMKGFNRLSPIQQESMLLEAIKQA